MESAVELGYALGIGMLIGLERAFEDEPGEQAQPQGDSPAHSEPGEPARPQAEEERAPASATADPMKDLMGVRTFAVLSLLGYSAALVGEQLSFVAPVALVGATLLVVAMYFRATHEGLGITTELAALATCALGMLCHTNHRVAGVIALLLTVILASKRFTYTTVRKMRRVELTDTLKFLAVILILLPLLPNRTFDPYGAFNPYKTGVLVVLISGIGFAGYFLTRILGARTGLGLTGIIGGLTSSTAVTAAMAAQAKEKPDLRAICAFSTVAANATMFLRVLVVVALLDIPLVKRLAWSLGGMTAVAIIATAVLWVVAGKSGRSEKSESEVPLKNPFSVGPALKFAAFFVFILFVLKLAKAYLGDQGLYAAAALSGLADVDAITLSVSEQARDGQMLREVGAIAITIAVVSNSITKTALAVYSGGWRFGRLIALCLGAATGVGLLIAVII